MHPRYIIDSSSDDDEQAAGHHPGAPNRRPLAEIPSNIPLPATGKRKASDHIAPESTKSAKVEGQELAVDQADQNNDETEEDEQEQLDFVLNAGGLSDAERNAILNALESTIPDPEYEVFFPDDQGDDEEEEASEVDRYGTPAVYTNAIDPLTATFINPDEAECKEYITSI